MSESGPKTAGAKTQCTANALPGSAALADKERLLSLHELYNWDGPGKWAYTMREECVVVRLDIEAPQGAGGEDNGGERGRSKGKGKERKEYVATFELDLNAYACNGFDMAHGGAICTLLDHCTSLVVPLSATGDAWLASGVTLSLTVNLLAPGVAGDRLRVVARTKSAGKRTASVWGEIWSERGLVATASHIKMVPVTGDAVLGLPGEQGSSKAE